MEDAITAVLAQDYRTADIWRGEGRLVGTEQMGALVSEGVMERQSDGEMERWSDRATAYR